MPPVARPSCLIALCVAVAPIRAAAGPAPGEAAGPGAVRSSGPAAGDARSPVGPTAVPAPPVARPAREAPASDPGPGVPAQAPPRRTAGRVARAPRPPEVTGAKAPRTFPGGAFGRCAKGATPCVRPHAGRMVLAAVGLLGASAGLAGLLLLGERAGARDPAGWMVGAGSVAVSGAIVGAIFGLSTGDAPGDPDRVRPGLVGLRSTFDAARVRGERHPPVLVGTTAPTWYFADGGGRMRFLLAVGGLAGSRTERDPRPQATGDAPALREDRLVVNAAVDLAVGLPYPVMAPRRSSFLGRAELRVRPEVQIRRHRYRSAGADRVVERTMFLPLTVGMRWHLSLRQRFTFYLGPRFDFVRSWTIGGGSDEAVELGGGAIGPLYGEAWYDIDVPFSLLAHRRGRRVHVVGLLSVGYVHSRFDGRSFNISGAIGFTGPVVASWTLRLRDTRSRWGAQIAAGAWIGSGVAPFVSIELLSPTRAKGP